MRMTVDLLAVTRPPLSLKTSNMLVYVLRSRLDFYFLLNSFIIYRVGPPVSLIFRSHYYNKQN